MRSPNANAAVHPAHTIPIPSPAHCLRNLAMTASVMPQKRRGDSMYPNGSRVAHISRPVPGWRTTSRFLLSSAMGTCQKPSLMSYFAKCEPGLMSARASHTLGSVNAADGTTRFVPTE